jgi:2,3-dihydroxybenzoate-AMP ligase
VVQNGGARLAPELRQRLITELGCTPQEIYGTAEGLINMTRLDDPLDIILHSSGRPVCDDDEIAVVDDDGAEVPDGEAGELITRGPLHHPGLLPGAGEERRGLHRRRLLPHGRHRAQMGPQHPGRGPAQGPDQPRRREDQLRRGRELHPPPPKVKSACLVAMPDPVFGEKACAFVILREGESLSFEG